MMARFVCVVSFSLVSLACTVPARANWICEFFHCMARDTKRRNCWPKPFVCPDRQAVRAPFVVMVNNGWRFQNMLGDHHFSGDGGELNEAGRLKVHWILTQAPQQHRTIYVYTAMTGEATAVRIESVRQVAAELVPHGPPPPVFVSNVPARGWPASQVDDIGRKFESSTPEPRLPVAEGTTSG